MDTRGAAEERESEGYNAASIQLWGKRRLSNMQRTLVQSQYVDENFGSWAEMFVGLSNRVDLG